METFSVLKKKYEKLWKDDNIEEIRKIINKMTELEDREHQESLIHYFLDAYSRMLTIITDNNPREYEENLTKISEDNRRLMDFYFEYEKLHHQWINKIDPSDAQALIILYNQKCNFIRRLCFNLANPVSHTIAKSYDDSFQKCFDIASKILHPLDPTILCVIYERILFDNFREDQIEKSSDVLKIIESLFKESFDNLPQRYFKESNQMLEKIKQEISNKYI